MKCVYNMDKDETQFQTFGGQAWLDSDWYVDEYGIQLGAVSVYEIPSSLMIHLAVEMVNHLRANGHEFEFVADPTSQDLPMKFSINTKQGDAQRSDH